MYNHVLLERASEIWRERYIRLSRLISDRTGESVLVCVWLKNYVWAGRSGASDDFFEVARHRSDNREIGR